MCLCLCLCVFVFVCICVCVCLCVWTLHFTHPLSTTHSYQDVITQLLPMLLDMCMASETLLLARIDPAEEDMVEALVCIQFICIQ
jgi:hypothetical protein